MRNRWMVRPLYAIFSLFFPSKFYGINNLPKEKALIVCNHYTALDPCFLYKYYKNDIFFLAKKEAFKKKNSAKFLTNLGAIPIDRENNDVRAMMQAIKVLKENNKLVVFPEGTRNKKNYELQPLKGGAGLFAIRTQSPIVPVMFYNRARIFKRVKIIVGKPFYLEEFYGKKLQKEDLDKVDEIIREKMIETRNNLVEIVQSKKKKSKGINSGSTDR